LPPSPMNAEMEKKKKERGKVSVAVCSNLPRREGKEGGKERREKRVLEKLHSGLLYGKSGTEDLIFLPKGKGKKGK